MVVQDRIELSLPDYKSGVLTVELLYHIKVVFILVHHKLHPKKKNRKLVIGFKPSGDGKEI